MKPEHFSSMNSSADRSPRFKQLCLLGGLGLWSGSLVLLAAPTLAQENEPEAPKSVESAPPVAPVETSAELLLKPQVTTSPAVEPTAPTPEVVPTAPIGESRPAETDADAAGEGYTNVFIDPTEYNLGATQAPDSPSLVFSDRSTGCQFTLEQGRPTRTCRATARGTGNSASGDDAIASGPAGEQGGFSLGPVTVGGNGVTVGGTTVISRDYFNERLRPLNLLRRGAEEFVFPLATPAPITSLFGWRQHPIFGDRRFHTGTDLGAPEGTPVVAAKDGEVHIADYLGGYGLTVTLRHSEGNQETRYAHLSRILVRPGESVQQGDVVGLVGSTGNSTGPHLHFELRELTAQGWMLVDTNELMDYTVAHLVDAINSPLQALGLAEKEDADQAEANEKDLMKMPYRPAQPNAS